ncbi:MAG: EamA family transporter [Atopobiaceae bacterium]|nr:EamA family transporter [Atopobiaceae bacterium]
MPSFSFVWPIGLVVLSNVAYQICSKSVPGNMSPFVSLFVTYVVGAVASLVAFFALGNHGGFAHELHKANWAPFALGLVIVGLEVGFIYAYRAGWEVSMASVVQSSFLAVALLVVGFVLYGEALSWTKVLGVAICLVGLWFINR